MRPIEECPVCGARGFEPYALDRWTPGRLHFAQARCSGCGLLAAQPRATDEELDAYYASAYYDQHWPDAEDVSAANRALYERCEWPLMQKLWAGGPPPSGARVLDVGAGYGILLRLLRDNGYAVTGSEMSARARRFCREQDLDVVDGKAPGLPFPAASFFEAAHLARLLREAGCESVKTEAFTYPAPRESPHWRLYKGFFRRLDRLLGHGEYLIAVGRKADGRLRP